MENMLTRKTLLDYIKIFSPNDYKKNDKVIYKYFKDRYGRKSKFCARLVFSRLFYICQNLGNAKKNLPENFVSPVK